MSSEESRKTGEAKGGIQAFLKADTEKAPAAVKDYMEGIKQAKKFLLSTYCKCLTLRWTGNKS